MKKFNDVQTSRMPQLHGGGEALLYTETTLIHSIITPRFCKIKFNRNLPSKLRFPK